MLYDVITNEQNDVTYVPTTMGNLLLAVIIVVLLLAAMLFSARKSRKLSVRQLAF